MRILMILLLFLASTVHAGIKEDLIGSWIGISHQTITVTHYKDDGTFSGTYFTPAFDVKTTFSGTWILDKDVLTLKYLESSSPVLRVPLVDKNRLVIKSKDRIVLQTLPKGIHLECNRVIFKKRKDVYPDWGKSK